MDSATAESVYNENYVALPMRHQSASNRMEYSWRYAGNWNRLEVEIAGEAVLAATDSLEEFISEHYWGYTLQRDGGCLEYHVEHVPWRLWQVCSSKLMCDAAGLYGAEFAEALDAPAQSAFLAEGSPVTVYRGVRIV